MILFLGLELSLTFAEQEAPPTNNPSSIIETEMVFFTPVLLLSAVGAIIILFLLISLCIIVTIKLVRVRQPNVEENQVFYFLFFLYSKL